MKTSLFLSLSVTAVLSTLCPVRATDITYNVSLLLNPNSIAEGAITGTITTDGTLGVLNASDILSWNLYGMGYVLAHAYINTANSFVEVGNNTSSSSTPDLTATAQNLYFNFSGTDGGYLGFLTQPLPNLGAFIGFNALNTADVFSYDQFYYYPGETVGTDDLDPLLSTESGTQIIATAPAASAVPDLPDTLPLLGLGLGALSAFGRRLRK